MITGLHAMFYTPDAEALRAFLRDKLQLPFVDSGGGGLIFQTPAVEIGCHPAERRCQGLSFICNDLPHTMAGLRRRGVEFTQGISEQSWGSVTQFKIPGGGEVELFRPNYRMRRIPPVRGGARRRRRGRTP